jgi:hypothetical protein
VIPNTRKGQKERKSNSLAARYCALSSSKRCLEMLCEDRRLEIKDLLAHLRAVTNDEAEAVAGHCDHYCIDGSKWWKAVKRARKFLKPYSAPSGLKSDSAAGVSAPA